MAIPDHWQRMFLLPEHKKDELKRRMEHLKMYCFSTPETEQSFNTIMDILKELKRE